MSVVAQYVLLFVLAAGCGCVVSLVCGAMRRSRDTHGDDLASLAHEIRALSTRRDQQRATATATVSLTSKEACEAISDLIAGQISRGAR